MRTPTTLLLALATALAASGCSASALQALASAAATGTAPGGGAASTPKATASPVISPSTTPSATAPEPGSSTSDAARLQVLADFQAKVDAASQDPEKVARLFVAAFAHYEADKQLAFQLMTLAVTDVERQADASSPSGFVFPAARSVYWPSVDRQPELPFIYFDSAANATVANAEDHVVIDDAYAAVDKGIDGKLATYYLKDNTGTVRSRPIRLELTAAGWRVSNYSSIVVGT